MNEPKIKSTWEEDIDGSPTKLYITENTKQMDLLPLIAILKVFGIKCQICEISQEEFDRLRFDEEDSDE